MTTSIESTPNNQSLPPIGILGAGNWGTVLSLLASHQLSKVYLYDRNSQRTHEMQAHRENKRYLPGIRIPNEVEVTSDLKKVFAECQLILPVVPSHAFRQFAREYSEYTRGDH